MITSYEVGAVFNIIDKASPTLKLLADQFNVLDRAILRTQDGLAKLSSQRFAGLGTRLKGINDQMAALGVNSGKAFGGLDAQIQGSIGRVQALKAEVASLGAQMRGIGRMNMLPGGGATGGAGGGGGANTRHAGSGGRGGHGGGMGIGAYHQLPGGLYMSHRGGGMGMAGLAAAGIIGYGAYEAGQMEDHLFSMLYHSGKEDNPENRNIFRSLLQKSMSQTGYSLTDTADAATTALRMFRGTPGNGLDVLPELLQAAAVESRLKGSTLKESMNSFIGLSHMTKEYSPEEIKKLAPAFAFLSASNPSSLKQMESAASYVVPMLQTGLEMDPVESLLMSTVLRRAGATSTKSGTWLRNMFMRAMPEPTLATDDKKADRFNALQALGLVDNKGKALWFNHGKPSAVKFFDIASEHAANLPLSTRSATEKNAFGALGMGAFALLADPAVKTQIKAMRKEMDSEEFQNRYASFMKDYSEGSPVQKFRETWEDLKIVLMDIGSIVLPPLLVGLKAFDGALKAIKGAMEWYMKVPQAGSGVDPDGLLNPGGGADETYVGGVKKMSFHPGGGGLGGYNEGHANIHAVNPELMARYNAMMAAAPESVRRQTRITSGYRDNALQAKLYARYLHGGPLAAPPGHSNHGRGLALDIHDGTGWVHRNASRFGLHFPLGHRDWPHMQMQGGGHIKPYKKPQGHGKQELVVYLDGAVVHRSVVRHERRATEHSHQAPAFDGYQDFSAPDGQIWAA